MAKQRKKKKVQPTAGFKIDKYIVEAARKLPIHKVFLDPDTIENKLGGVVVSRKRPNGEIIFCSYIVDLGCLGVKDVYFDYLEEEVFDEFILELGDDVGSVFEEIDINYAANIIYGAVEYADQLGIAPVDQFDSICAYMLPDVDDVEYMEIECGIDGKPHLRYEAGTKANSYIDKLSKAVGDDNFTYEFFEEDEWDEDDEEEWEEDEDDDDTNEYTEYEEVKTDD